VQGLLRFQCEGSIQGLSEESRVQGLGRFRGGLVFKAHRLVYHSTLGLRVIKKKKVWDGPAPYAVDAAAHAGPADTCERVSRVRLVSRFTTLD